LLARLALFRVMYHGLGRYSGTNGPKSDPNFCARSNSRRVLYVELGLGLACQRRI
jgi:hypothetical protein